MGACNCCQLQRDRDATPLPVMFESKYHGHSKISMNGLCSSKTSHLCDTTIRCIDALSAYHGFVDSLREDHSSGDGDSTLNGRTSPPLSVIELIPKRRNIDEYSPEMLRADYHHFVEYHRSNKQYMRRCYERLMNINEHQDIIDLFDITDRINTEKRDGDYFGHRMADEQAMITTLNELHQDLSHDIDDDSGDDLDHDEEDSMGPLDLIKKLRVRPQYRMAGTHLVHQESLELGSLTPVGYTGSHGHVILPEEARRMVAMVNEEEEVFPDTETPSMFPDNYEVDGY